MWKPFKQRYLVLAALLVAVFVTATTASADHSWDGNHWRSDNLSPTVVNKTTSSLYNVPAGVAEWANLSAPINPVMATGTKGNITVSEGSSVFWAGLARIFIQDGHITKGEVKLNTRYLRTVGGAAADHVLCQEMGHVLGLDHNRTQTDTCMNDQIAVGSATSPNAHDDQQLNLIYNHVDLTGGTTTNAHAGNGFWITVHVTPIP